MLIREAIEKDLPDVLELLRSMDGESEMDSGEALNIWNKIKQYPYYKLLVVEDNNRIIGTCSLIIIDNLGHKGAKLAVVESVIVERKFRGRGVGHIMMNHVMEMAKKEKCYKIMLSSNKKRILAHRFYQKLGFKQHGISFVVEVT
jgi:N-acetylglutamate synthase-like GNAT family acetyltransferase